MLFHKGRHDSTKKMDVQKSKLLESSPKAPENADLLPINNLAGLVDHQHNVVLPGGQPTFRTAQVNGKHTVLTALPVVLSRLNTCHPDFCGQRAWAGGIPL